MINKKDTSYYGIFFNKKTNKTIVYYPCPKNANTSTKLFFLRHIEAADQFVFIGDKIPFYKQTEKDYNGKKNLVKFLPTKQPFSKIDVDIKCCIIRNPIDRFISSFKNRILFHRDVEFKNHSIDMILDKLEDGLFENRHFLPQNFFLGDDLNYYSFYADIKKINFFKEQVNEFFGKKIEFPKVQTGGKEFDIQLNNTQLNRVNKIYEKDFEVFGSKL